MPPNLAFDPERLRSFLELLPRNTKEASDLGAKHNQKLKARAFLKIDISRPLRYALEVRHPSFMTADFFKLLRRNIAFMIADTAKKFSYAEDLMADFVYCSLHGTKELYASGYSAKALDWWANRIGHWRAGRQPRDASLVTGRKIDNQRRDVFVYVDNDAKVRAPYDAIGLATRLTS